MLLNGQSTGPQPPGLRSAYLIPISSIAQFPYPALYDLIDQPLQLKPNAIVYQVLSLADPATLRAERGLDGTGRVYDWRIQVNLPGNESDTELLATAFVRQPFVLITVDLTGMTMLHGTPGQPLRCQVLQSSAGASGQRRIRMTFRGSGNVPTFLYEASLPTHRGAGQTHILNNVIGSNAPGLREITLIPAHRVVSIPLPDDDNVLPSGPEVLEGTETITILTSHLDASYSQTITQDEVGVYYTQEVAVTLPTDHPRKLDLYNFWVVLATDMHGTQRLIGRPDEYLTGRLQQSNDSQRRLRLRLRGNTTVVSHRLTSPPVSVPEPPPPPVVEPLQDFREDDFSREDFL